MISMSDFYDQIFDMIIRQKEDWMHISKPILYEFLSKPSTALKLYNMSKDYLFLYYFMLKLVRVYINSRNYEKHVRIGGFGSQ